MLLGPHPDTETSYLNFVSPDIGISIDGDVELLDAVFENSPADQGAVSSETGDHTDMEDAIGDIDHDTVPGFNDTANTEGTLVENVRFNTISFYNPVELNPVSATSSTLASSDGSSSSIINSSLELNPVSTTSSTLASSGRSSSSIINSSLELNPGSTTSNTLASSDRSSPSIINSSLELNPGSTTSYTLACSNRSSSSIINSSVELNPGSTTNNTLACSNRSSSSIINSSVELNPGSTTSNTLACSNRSSSSIINSSVELNPGSTTSSFADTCSTVTVTNNPDASSVNSSVDFGGIFTDSLSLSATDSQNVNGLHSASRCPFTDGFSALDDPCIDCSCALNGEISTIVSLIPRDSGAVNVSCKDFYGDLSEKDSANVFTDPRGSEALNIPGMDCPNALNVLGSTKDFSESNWSTTHVFSAANNTCSHDTSGKICSSSKSGFRTVKCPANVNPNTTDEKAVAVEKSETNLQFVLKSSGAGNSVIFKNPGLFRVRNIIYTDDQNVSSSVREDFRGCKKPSGEQGNMCLMVSDIVDDVVNDTINQHVTRGQSNLE